VKLIDAVALYVARRRSEGAPFISTEVVLRSLCKFCGAIELRDLTAGRIQEFLELPRCAAITRLTKFSAVKCFVEHYSVRKQLVVLPLQKPPSPNAKRGPYIYTQAQLRILFDAARTHSCRNDSLNGDTLRIVLLLLYAMGASLQEVLSLRRSGLDLDAQRISLSCRPLNRRLLPLGTDLCEELREYLRGDRRADPHRDLLFSCKDGRRIKRSNLWYHFVKLHKCAGLAKTAAGDGPRLQDLRFTFAVHRLSGCIQKGESLTDLIPALSSYMGYTSLTKAEQYLAYVPERFADDLCKLSPMKQRGHWRDVPGLMYFLRSL
jgi:integrase/recombinase XerD